MKRIYIPFIEEGIYQELIIPIKFPFKTKKEMMNCINSRWKDVPKLVDFLDKKINSGVTYDILLIIKLKYCSYSKKLGIREIKFVLSCADLKIEEPRLHRLAEYYSYETPNYKQLLNSFTREKFKREIKLKVYKANSPILFAISLQYILSNSRALYM